MTAECDPVERILLKHRKSLKRTDFEDRKPENEQSYRVGVFKCAE